MILSVVSKIIVANVCFVVGFGLRKIVRAAGPLFRIVLFRGIKRNIGMCFYFDHCSWFLSYAYVGGGRFFEAPQHHLALNPSCQLAHFLWTT